MAQRIGSRSLRSLDLVRCLPGATPSNCFVWCYGTEFTSNALDHWAYRNIVHLDFIHPGRLVENGYIERTHSTLGVRTPAEFAATCTAATAAPLNILA